MKNKRLIIIFGFLIALFFSVLSITKIEAVSVETENFTYSIGNENNEVWAVLNQNEDKTYTLQFEVLINGKKNGSNTLLFDWTNVFAYYVDGVRYEEIDNNVLEINPYEDYSMFFFDEHMPTFIKGETPVIEKVYFKSTMVCKNCGIGQENEGYAYSIQEVAEIELDVKYDITDPTLCEDSSTCSYVVGGSYINEIPFKFTAKDDQSGLKLLKYAFLNNSNPTSDLVTEDFINGEEFYFAPSREDLINKVTVYTSVYLYIFIQDYAGNYAFYRIYDTPYRYNFDAVTTNTLEYNESTSVIPDTTSYYKEVNLTINTSNPLYYQWNTSGYVNANNVRTNGTLYENGISFSYSGTATIDLYLISFMNETDFTYLILSYTFDNTRPYIEQESFPTNETKKKNVSVSFTFNDTLSGFKNAFYLISDSLLDVTELSSINGVYTNGSTIEVGENLNGTYYIYFLVYDNLDNYYSFYLTYIFDNIAPTYTLSVSEEDALLVSNGINILINVDDLKESSFRCGWFIDGMEVSTDDLNRTCSNNSNVIAPSSSEGYYRLWMFLEDEAGNNLLACSYKFLIDAIGPIIQTTISFTDLSYRDNNHITIHVSDTYSNVSSIRYGWYLEQQVITSGTSLPNEITNNSSINYPNNTYGIYSLWVYSEDSSNNSTLSKISQQFYIDTETYSLTLVGEEVVTIARNENYHDLGVVALKGTREMEYEINSTLNNKKAGEYYITYSLDDLEVTRKIIVKETRNYYVISLSVFLGCLLFSFIPFKRKKV